MQRNLLQLQVLCEMQLQVSSTTALQRTLASFANTQLEQQKFYRLQQPELQESQEISLLIFSSFLY